MMVAVNCWSSTAGWPPSWPPVTWLFCTEIAWITSVGVRSNWLSLLGSSHTRMAYWAPNSWVVPTPCTRLSGSWTLAPR